MAMRQIYKTPWAPPTFDYRLFHLVYPKPAEGLKPTPRLSTIFMELEKPSKSRKIVQDSQAIHLDPYLLSLGALLLDIARCKAAKVDTYRDINQIYNGHLQSLQLFQQSSGEEGLCKVIDMCFERSPMPNFWDAITQAMERYYKDFVSLSRDSVDALGPWQDHWGAKGHHFLAEHDPDTGFSTSDEMGGLMDGLVVENSSHGGQATK